MTSDTHRPLRVVHLIKGLGPGGAERLIVNQLEVSDPTFEYTVLRVLEHQNHLAKAVESSGASTGVIGGGAFWPLALRKKLANLEPDVVHAHSPLLAIVVRLLVRFTRLDTVVLTTEHNRWPRHHPLTRLGNRLTAGFDTARIAVSEDVRQSMSASLHETTTVLDHGVPLNQLQQLASKRDETRRQLLGPAADDTLVIGIVANFRPEKAYDTFVNAAEAFLHEPQSKVRFIVVGHGPGEADLRQTIEDKSLSHWVDVLGYRDDATTVMTSFDIFTMTSRHEGKPVALMEALALGLPVAATRAGGIPEVISHGRNGLLAEIDDVDAIVEQWKLLVNDPQLRRELGQAAARSAAGFDSSTATRSIESTYREISSG